MKAVKAVAVAAVILALAFNASAKKLNLMNIDKGMMFNDTGSNAQMALVEEHAEKGKMMMKVTVPKGDASQPFWIVDLPAKKALWDGYDVIKFKAFNPGSKPLAIGLTVKFDYDKAYERRFNQSIMLKPGKSDCEVEIAGVSDNGGNPIDWKKKIFLWGFDGSVSATNDIEFYIGSITLETADEGEKEEKTEKKK